MHAHTMLLYMHARNALSVVLIFSYDKTVKTSTSKKSGGVILDVIILSETTVPYLIPIASYIDFARHKGKSCVMESPLL